MSRELVALIEYGTGAGGHHVERRLRVLIEADEDDGGFIASIVGNPGIASQGDTELQAAQSVVDAWMCASDT